MTVQELAQRFNISTRTIATWRTRYKDFPPTPCGGKHCGRYSSPYGRAHVEWIQAHLALRHNSVSTAAAVAHCQEAGITLPQYVRQRELAIKTHGIWDMAF